MIHLEAPRSGREIANGVTPRVRIPQPGPRVGL